MSTEFKAFVTETLQALHSPACTYTPQQNGVIERVWGKVFSLARTLLHAAGLPTGFHPHAVQFANWIRNREPSLSSKRSHMSHIQCLNPKMRASLDYLRVFGCACLVYRPLAKRSGKFDDRATCGIYLGPSAITPGAIVFLPDHQTVIVSRHLRCFEDILPGMAKPSTYARLLHKLDASADDPIPHPQSTGLDSTQSLPSHSNTTAPVTSQSNPPGNTIAKDLSTVIVEPHEAPSDSSSTAANPDTDELYIAPAHLWPSEACHELNGKGWVVRIVKRSNHTTRPRALIRFENTLSDSGTPFEAWINPNVLLPFTSHNQSNSSDDSSDDEVHVLDSSTTTPTQRQTAPNNVTAPNTANNTSPAPTPTAIAPAPAANPVSATPSSTSARQHPSRHRATPNRLTTSGRTFRYGAMAATFYDPSFATETAAISNFLQTPTFHNHPAFLFATPVGMAAVIQPTLDFGDVQIPTSYRNAVMSALKDYWIAAINKELEGLIANDTWDVVNECDIPPGSNIMNCHFVFAVKRNPDGSVAKFKARLVADGNSQKYGVDFDRVFATVVKMSTLRLMLLLAALNDYNLSSLDVTQAFLQAHVEDDLFMRVPPGLPRYRDGQKLIIKLRRSLYGLRQASRAWQELLVSFLLEWGMTRSRIDTCLFTYTSGCTILWLAVWVDDVVIVDNSEALRDRFISAISAKFPIEDTPTLDWVLGIKVTRDRAARKIILSQSLYVKDLVQKFAGHLTDITRRFDTPLSDSIVYDTSQCPAPESPEANEMTSYHAHYMSIIGALHWLLCTRVDLTYTVSVLSRFVNNPGMLHYKALQRVLAYLSSTSDMSLTLQATTGTPRGLDLYSDASWDSKFSTSGSLIQYNGAPVVWYSRLQRSVVHSTAEAEYVAASLACREGLFICELLEDLGQTTPKPIPLYLDCKSAIDMAFDPVAFKKTKHILREAFYLRDLVAREIFKPSHVPSRLQKADIFTKPLPRPLFVPARDSLLTATDENESPQHVPTGGPLRPRGGGPEEPEQAPHDPIIFNAYSTPTIEPLRPRGGGSEEPGHTNSRGRMRRGEPKPHRAMAPVPGGVALNQDAGPSLLNQDAGPSLFRTHPNLINASEYLDRERALQQLLDVWDDVLYALKDSPITNQIVYTRLDLVAAAWGQRVMMDPTRRAIAAAIYYNLDKYKRNASQPASCQLTGATLGNMRAWHAKLAKHWEATLELFPPPAPQGPLPELPDF